MNNEVLKRARIRALEENRSVNAVLGQYLLPPLRSSVDLFHRNVTRLSVPPPDEVMRHIFKENFGFGFTRMIEGGRDFADAFFNPGK